MKKTVLLLSALFFSFALVIPSLMWADDMKHMEEDSGKKMDKTSHGEYKDKKQSKEYKHGEGHRKEGSDGKEMHDKKADHGKMEEGSKDGKQKEMSAPKKEGS